ncbi:hypothetical protein EMCRGX_G030895 [Ephydatia muelleri]
MRKCTTFDNCDLDYKSSAPHKKIDLRDIPLIPVGDGYREVKELLMNSPMEKQRELIECVVLPTPASGVGWSNF